MRSILFDCERMKYPNTGPYQVCENVGKNLIKNIKPDERLTFLVPPHLDGFFGHKASYYKLSLINKLYLPWTNSRWMLGTKKFDVWHITYQSSMYVPFGRNTKIVLTILDLNFLHENPGAKNNARNLKLIQDRVDRADHITTISDFALADVKNHLDLKGKPATTVYIGCDFDNPVSPEAPQQLPSKPFLFSLGTVLPKKNFHVLPCLLQGNDYDLLIAGISKTDYKNKIEEEAKRFGVSDRVKFLGPITESLKTWYYQHCEAFLFPSIAEGFGLPVVEAMSHGKPVFISTHTSLPEVGGKMAYYFPDFSPENMQKVFAEGLQHYHAKHPQNEIKTWAHNFDWANTAKSYLNIYRNL